MKKNTNVKVTSRFINSKMLMFAEVSLTIFVYDVTDVLDFPNKYVSDIFAKNDVLKCHLYLPLTETDSESIIFVFICKIHCSITEDQGRKLIFQILTELKLLERLG